MYNIFPCLPSASFGYSYLFDHFDPVSEKQWLKKFVSINKKTNCDWIWKRSSCDWFREILNLNHFCSLFLQVGTCEDCYIFSILLAKDIWHYFLKGFKPPLKSIESFRFRCNWHSFCLKTYKILSKHLVVSKRGILVFNRLNICEVDCKTILSSNCVNFIEHNRELLQLK